MGLTKEKNCQAVLGMAGRWREIFDRPKRKEKVKKKNKKKRKEKKKKRKGKEKELTPNEA